MTNSNDLYQASEAAQSVIENTDKQEKKKGPIWKAAVVATLAMSALSACGTNAEKPPQTGIEQPPITPPETSPEVTFEQKVEAYQIPDGLSTDELGNAITDRLTFWLNAGASEDLNVKAMEANTAWDNFLPPLAKEEAQAAAKGLLINNWQEQENLVRFVDKMEEMNLTTLRGFAGTNWAERSPEGFNTWFTVENIIEQKGGDKYRQLGIEYLLENNSEYTSLDPVNEPMGRLIINTEVVDGNVKIIAATFEDL